MRKCCSIECNKEAEFMFCSECEATNELKPKEFISSEIENRFMYHAPKQGQPEKYEAIRSKAKELAHMIDELCPNSREKSVAMTELETAIFWANAAIARNE